MIGPPTLVLRASAAIAAGVVLLSLAPSQALAAPSYTVYWNTASSPYAYGWAYSTTNCTGAKVTLDNSHTSASGRRSIKSPTWTDFTWGGTRPTTERITYSTCYKLPASGLWYGYDPAR